MNFEIGDERDISLNLLKKEMDALIERGATVFVKFTCQYCFSRQTSDTLMQFISVDTPVKNVED